MNYWLPHIWRLIVQQKLGGEDAAPPLANSYNIIFCTRQMNTALLWCCLNLAALTLMICDLVKIDTEFCLPLVLSD